MAERRVAVTEAVDSTTARAAEYEALVGVQRAGRARYGGIDRCTRLGRYDGVADTARRHEETSAVDDGRSVGCVGNLTVHCYTSPVGVAARVDVDASVREVEPAEAVVAAGVVYAALIEAGRHGRSRRLHAVR